MLQGQSEEDHMRRTSLTRSTIVALAALALAAAAIASPALAGRAQPAPAGGAPVPAVNASTGMNQPAITVHGTGTVTLTPDMATVVLGVDARQPTAKAAQAAASSAMNAVIAAVKRHNIAAADMATVSISLGPVYDYSGNTQKLTGWEAQQALSVEDRNLADTGSLIDDAVAAGANSVQGVTLSVANPGAATAQARAAAVADAKARAQGLASAAGVTLGSPISIEETGAPSPTPVPMAAPAAGAMASTPIVPGSFEVTVTVDITYAID
jgi:uncharacterized protein YggE